MLRSADADGAHLAFLLKLAQRRERGGIAVPGARPGVQLEQVDAFRAQLAQAPLQPLAQVGGAEALLDIVVGTWRPVARGGRYLRRDIDSLVAAAVLEDLRDDPFAAPIAIALRRVDEIAAEVQGPVQRGDGILVGLASPATADGPAAEADFRYVPAQTPEGAVFHCSDYLGRDCDIRPGGR